MKVFVDTMGKCTLWALGCVTLPLVNDRSADPAKVGAVGVFAVSINDSMMVRSVMRDIARQPIDASRLNVFASNGVVRLSGVLTALRGQPVEMDLEERLHILIRVIKQRPGVRDVVAEVELGNKRSIWEDSRKKHKRY